MRSIRCAESRECTTGCTAVRSREPLPPCPYPPSPSRTAPISGSPAFFAASLLPQMNIVGLPPANCGLTMNAVPTELNAFTKCRRAVKIALQLLHQRLILRGKKSQNTVHRRRILNRVTGIHHCLARQDVLARQRQHIGAASPLTARRSNRQIAAASAKLPTDPPGFLAAQSLSLLAVLVPILTWWPCLSNPWPMSLPPLLIQELQPSFPPSIEPESSRISLSDQIPGARPCAVRTIVFTPSYEICPPAVSLSSELLGCSTSQ